MPERKDFLDENINVGDVVVYLKNCRGYRYKTSTCKCVGMIERFTNQMVVIRPLGPMNKFVKPNEYDNAYPTIRISLSNVICVIK